MWSRAAWKEPKQEEEGVIPTCWIVNNNVFWPLSNIQRHLRNQTVPDESWNKFPLIKVKISSDAYKQCEDFNLTSEMETDIELEEDIRHRKKRVAKKSLPTDFISGGECSADMDQGVGNQKTNQARSPQLPKPPAYLKRHSNKDASNSSQLRKQSATEYSHQSDEDCSPPGSPLSRDTNKEATSNSQLTKQSASNNSHSSRDDDFSTSGSLSVRNANKGVTSNSQTSKPSSGKHSHRSRNEDCSTSGSHLTSDKNKDASSNSQIRKHPTDKHSHGSREKGCSRSRSHLEDDYHRGELNNSQSSQYSISSVASLSPSRKSREEYSSSESHFGRDTQRLGTSKSRRKRSRSPIRHSHKSTEKGDCSPFGLHLRTPLHKHSSASKNPHRSLTNRTQISPPKKSTAHSSRIEYHGGASNITSTSLFSNSPVRRSPVTHSHKSREEEECSSPSGWNFRKEMNTHFNSPTRHSHKSRERSPERSSPGAAIISRKKDKFPLSTSDFQRKTLTLLMEIRNAVVKQPHPRGLEVEPQLFKIHRAESEADFLEIERKLHVDDTYRANTISYIKTIGGADSRDQVKRIMSRIMDNMCMSKINMNGAGGKVAFEKTKTFEIIKDIVQASSGGTEKDITSYVQRYLKYAPDRKGGSGRKSKD